MRFDRVVVASKNQDKVAEVEAVLAELGIVGEIVRDLDWIDVDETEPTLEGNARLKARTVGRHTGLVSVADDTGLEVDALGGRPGVISARYAGHDATYADNVRKLLEELADTDARSARFRTVIAVFDPSSGKEWMAEGVLRGEITRAPRGTFGFGYDPVFAVDGVTLGEMAPEQKSSMSHRARALRALAALLIDGES